VPNLCQTCGKVVGVIGFEPTTPSSRTSGTLLKYLIFLAQTRRNPVNKSGNERHYCADTVPSDKAKLEALLRIAAEQWSHKSPEDQATERRFIERDYKALTGCKVALK